MVSHGTRMPVLGLVAWTPSKPPSLRRPCGFLYYTVALVQKIGSTITWVSFKFQCITFHMISYKQWIRTAWITSSHGGNSAKFIQDVHVETHGECCEMDRFGHSYDNVTFLVGFAHTSLMLGISLSTPWKYQYNDLLSWSKFQFSQLHDD